MHIRHYIPCQRQASFFKSIRFRSMARHLTLDSSPPVHRGMKDFLDRSAFRKSIPVLAARMPAAKTGPFLKADPMKGLLMDLPKIRSVVRDHASSEGEKLVLLRVSREDELPINARQYLRDECNGLTTYSLELDYDYWTADDIMRAILPDELLDGSPTGFAMTGHIAHLNLNKEYLPYKHIIGQIILDKNKSIKTVVNKLDSIDNQFRFFKMELIAGEPDYIVEHHESDCRFTFDFSQVYWNSRLHTEHGRLIQLFHPEDLIADVFAGVGPFAIPAAKRGCAVFANDLNPSSAKYLEKNAVDNRVTDFVRVSCEDGRDFIRTVIARVSQNPFPPSGGPKLSKSKAKEQRRRTQNAAPPGADAPANHTDSGTPRNRISRFVMNLPDSAIDFLDAFQGILSSPDHERDLNGVYVTLPMIHCYCFTRELELSNAHADILQRVQSRLGHEINEDVSLHFVRSVAPNKDMYCISFRLPPKVAFAR